ncbi:MAG: cellulase-like family protein [FCB group bacterium]|jgi:hypothetical protein|nr:cellulase-like family protein [FCB group bacterium]
MDRRDFLKVSGAAAGLVLANERGLAQTAAKAQALPSVTQVKDPVAIAMWDFSWLLRHHPAGEFADWSKTLDELVARGYNAVRIDAFPALVAADPDGKVVEEYYFGKNDWKPAMWGHQYSVSVRPREALLEFLPKCTERGIHVGFSTWFSGPGVEKVEGLDGLVRVWNETLSFLDGHGLLDNVFYVDLLNEYPLFHGFSWLEKELKAIREKDLNAIPDAEQRERQAHQWDKDMGHYNGMQQAFYRTFLCDAIARLRGNWPGLNFFASQTCNDGVPWQNLDFSCTSALDVHNWFVLNGTLGQNTGYWENIHNLADNDRKFPEVNAALKANWTANKDALVVWMSEFMQSVAKKGRELGIPYGNTEGWGIINWLDHPALDWDIIKEAAELCARLGIENGYTFNCTSNFTHPQFPRLWADVEWNRKVTSIIRGA